MDRWRWRIAWALVLVWSAWAHGQVQLPVLNWQPTPDWVNVKTDVQPAAKGDGGADDTAALQAALDRMHGLGGPPKVVYLPPGTYRITDTLVMPNSLGCMVIGHGADTRIVWDGRTEHSVPVSATGASLELLKKNPNFPAKPDEEKTLSPAELEVPDRGDRYGERIVAYLRPPATGKYTFWVSGDDQCEVWLAPGAKPDGAKLICSVPSWTQPRAWDWHKEQQSAPVELTAGQFYHVEILHKEGGGGGHVAVGWQLPDGTKALPIPIADVYEQPKAEAKNGFLYQFWNDCPPVLSRMLWSNGATSAVYRGIVWDGNGKARIGFHHYARDRFECKVRHEYEAFVNFTETGVLMGPQNPFATSESEFLNCIFADCAKGISIIDFNYYNEVADACVFLRCGTGIHTERYGEIYARNCRFEGSREADLVLGDSHKHSARRCMSAGSRAFIVGHHATVQDCRVLGWTGGDGAISITSAERPVVVFDCVFNDPPSDDAPIRFSDPASRVIVSNNRCDRAKTLVSGTEHVIQVPAGKLGGSLPADGPKVVVPPVGAPKVFDAVRDFGVDKARDATDAIQATIDAAREYGRGAVAYFPPIGRYPITKSINITGADYVIAGTGYYTQFQWAGEEGGVVLKVVDPQRITIRGIHVIGHAVPEDMLGIRQTSTGKSSSISYENVSVPEGYRPGDKRAVRGIEFVGLGKECSVHVRRINGSGAFINSTAANILARFWDGGPLIVENPAGAPRTGFLGMLNGNTGGLIVRDSLDFVAGDLYCEQGKDGMVRLSGKPGDAPGRVTIGAARLHLWKEAPFFVEIDNYAGRLCYAHADVTFDRSAERYLVKQQGEAPVDVVFMALNRFDFEFRLGPAARRIFAANNGTDDIIPEGGLAAIGAALDHFRLLGMKDVEFSSQK